MPATAARCSTRTATSPSRSCEYVPPWRRNDVIYFNPADIEYPIGFNPLANVEPDRRPLVVSTVVDALHSLWPDSWGPQLQMFLEATCGALLEMPGATLPQINLMLTDAKFRALRVAACSGCRRAQLLGARLRPDAREGTARAEPVDAQ